ncbi:PepSY domain-containing protein [Paracoccus sp. (in: a-proteobacteria)]|uniref:PepSY domain-containing protein n=1 Tax=Paracoccus sp. TaxID=267 RepID=UPI00321FC37C
MTLAILSLPQAAGSQTMSRPDYEFAREAVARGEILPLAEVLSRLQASHPGQVTEVELARERGRLVYEVGLVTPGGRLIEVATDAATGRVLGVHGGPASVAGRLGRDGEAGDNGRGGPGGGHDGDDDSDDDDGDSDGDGDGGSDSDGDDD